MTKAQAKQEALGRASGVLQSYADEGGIWEHYQDLPEDDQEKISEEFKRIIEQLEQRWRKAE